jgi:glycosyltransferase involved in cell wall biosynthesis
MDVSVVIPVLNARPWVGRAIESALAQTVPPVEVIVVDDGSTDGSLEHVRERFPGVRAERSPGTGVSAARNFGITLARGECTAFLDADDVWAPWKLERQLAAVGCFPGWGMSVTDGRKFVPGEVVDWGTRSPAPRRGPRLVGFAALLRCSGVFTSSVLVRRAVLDEVGLFDETLGGPEDKDLWLRVAHRHPLVELSEALVGYQDTPGSLSKPLLTQGLGRLQVIARWRDAEPDAVKRALRRRASNLVRKLLRAGLKEEARSVYAGWLTRTGRMGTADRLAFGLLRARCRPRPGHPRQEP